MSISNAHSYADGNTLTDTNSDRTTRGPPSLRPLMRAARTSLFIEVISGFVVDARDY
jgi:hypothetical protein